MKTSAILSKLISAAVLLVVTSFSANALPPEKQLYEKMKLEREAQQTATPAEKQIAAQKKLQGETKHWVDPRDAKRDAAKNKESNFQKKHEGEEGTVSGRTGSADIKKNTRDPRRP